MPYVATDVSKHCSRDVSIDVSGLEAPLLIPGLKAWFDARTNAYMTISTGISAWVSRAGSLGSIARVQVTAANQPAYVTSVAQLNGQNAIQLNGVDQFFDTDNQNAWKFMHQNGSRFSVLRVDSTGGAIQAYERSGQGSSTVGALSQFSTTSVLLQILNGSGTVCNNWTNSTTGHFERDVSRWWMWGYDGENQHSRVSGSSVTNADAVGQDPSANNPSIVMRTGASTTGTVPLKALVAQDLYFDHVLTAGETAQLAAWAATQYGVAA